MPSITIELFSGRTLDQKRRLVAAVTDAVVQTLEVKPDIVRIRLVEMERHQLARAGILYTDREGAGKHSTGP
jgi:4-oxalocrotonate tautomerase